MKKEPWSKPFKRPKKITSNGDIHISAAISKEEHNILKNYANGRSINMLAYDHQIHPTTMIRTLRSIIKKFFS